MLPNLSPLTGKFITFEGIEGVGKTTNIKFVRELLEKQGIAVKLTKEPGGTVVGEQVRQQLLHSQEEKLYPETEALLLFAARKQHLELVIKPQLLAKKCVLCDRFTDSTYAYQGGGRGITAQEIASMENFIQGDLRPDFTIIFDAPVDIALKRANARNKADRIESETIDFFNRVRQVYLDRAKSWPGSYHIIDTTRDLASVQEELKSLFTVTAQCSI